MLCGSARSILGEMVTHQTDLYNPQTSAAVNALIAKSRGRWNMHRCDRSVNGVLSGFPPREW